MTNWLPDISDAQTTKYLALADEIASAIKDGSLPPGTKMPPQRNLAYDIGVTLGTVSRGYKEAERRGLIGGEVGRGTFVLGNRPRQTDDYLIPDDDLPAGVIDLGRAIPIPGRAGAALAESMAEIAQDPNIDALCNYQLNTGMAPHLEVGATWMERQGVDHASADRITITSGTQHGIMACLMALTNPGDTILVDTLTYPGIIHLARSFGYRLETVAADENGMIPEALEEACRRYAPSMLYFMPNLHNPTAISMPADRRIEIAEVAKKTGLFILEDDIWGPLINTNTPLITNLLPDQTFYLSSFSKCMAPGLRIGYIHGPSRLTERLRASIRVSCWMPPPLMAEVTRRWILDGTGDELINWQREQTTLRSDAALACLTNHKVSYYPGAHHLWLELPEPWNARDFKSRAEERGVRIFASDAFAVDRHKAPDAIRLSFGRPDTVEEIVKGMTILTEILDEDPESNFNIL
ncbi:MAG: PLP-dependent aminotransferase family protein [Rhodospirillales bacterium]|jgi:DNA-binding transcriptional MocR family regulator|nr:PLP-dependent aminotransferase family protein [Rhodospirillales bacterium]